MAIYFITILLCFISGISKQLKDNKTWLFIMLAYLCVFLCFSYMPGSDWRSYEIMYNEIDIYALFSTCKVEPGYYVYMYPFKLLQVDFWHFYIFTKVVVFILLVNVLIKYSEDYIFISLMFFVAWYGLYLFIDNPMRNLIAVAICTTGIKYLLERNFWMYFLFVGIAITFHISAIIMLPVYFYFTKRVPSKVHILIFVLVYTVFATPEFFWTILSKVFGWVPYVSRKIESYTISNEGRFLSLGTIIHVLFFGLLMFYRKRIELLKNGVLLFNAAIMYLLFYRIAITIEIFGRMLYYFCVFYTVVIVALITIFEYKSRIMYIIYLLLLSLISTARVFDDFRYVPYTNYIPYFVKGKYPSFEERTTYNYQHSPYHKENK
ncbi:MAG: EpsG family protein [Bacteroidales bacterium]|nr:EpsG family protein [Bacteroidales bacterium]